MSSQGVSWFSYTWNKYMVPNLYVFTGTAVGVFLITPMLKGKVPLLNSLGKWEEPLWAGIYAGVSNSVAQQMEVKK